MGKFPMLKKLVSPLRFIPFVENWLRDQKALGLPQWQVVVFHDMLCPKRKRHFPFVDSFSVDLEKIPRFLKEPTDPSLAQGPKLDRRERDYIHCGKWFQPSSTLDCRFFLEEVGFLGIPERMGPSGWIQGSYVDQEDDWTPRASCELHQQILFKEGHMVREASQDILGWTDATPVLQISVILERKESDFEVEGIEAPETKGWFSDVL